MSDNITSEQYNNYKEQFDMYNDEILKTKKTLSHYKKMAIATVKESNKIKNGLNTNKSKSRKNELVEMAKSIKKLKVKHSKILKKIKNLKNDIKIAEFNLKDVKWMSEINNIDDLKKFVRTCDFLADTWAIS